MLRPTPKIAGSAPLPQAATMTPFRPLPQHIAFAAGMLLTLLVLAPGLSGSWFFDDYPNIVNNPDVHPARLGLAELATAALSSPASDIGRPLASLSFATNHAVNGLNPFGWKLVNLLIHLLNGGLVFLVSTALLRAVPKSGASTRSRDGLITTLVATAWLLLPINLAPALFVVQRMESMANAFVLLGLLGYLRGRQRILLGNGGLAWCSISLVAPTALGLLAKETAALLPLYASFAECLLFGFRRMDGLRDHRLLALFAVVLALPALLGLAWLLPALMQPTAWETRDFTMTTRLLSEARIVVGYIGWTLLPIPRVLSFYHDDFVISQGLLSPWTTLASLLALCVMLAAIVRLRHSQPLVALGFAWFLGAHLLTGTILPLELIYEHRNYFASFGLLLAAVPWLAAKTPVLTLPRHALLAALMLWWAGLTALTAYAWGNPFRLATELAIRASDSPRAQFGFGKELLTLSRYDATSPHFERGVQVLERASSLPASSILPEQTLILTAHLLHRPVEERWWTSLIAKLADKAPNSEDVDALGMLTRCAAKRDCDLSRDRMEAAFAAAESHPRANAKLLIIHADWAWSVLDDHVLGERYADAAVRVQPRDADARITLARMNIVLGNIDKAREQASALKSTNSLGRLDGPISELNALIASRSPRS